MTTLTLTLHSAGELAVLGVLLKRGGAQQLDALQFAIENAPATSGGAGRNIEAVDLELVLGQVLADTANRGEPSFRLIFGNDPNV